MAIYSLYRISPIYPFNLGTLGWKKKLQKHHSNQRFQDQPHCCRYEAFADITRPQKNGRHPPSEWFEYDHFYDWPDIIYPKSRENKYSLYSYSIPYVFLQKHKHLLKIIPTVDGISPFSIGTTSSIRVCFPFLCYQRVPHLQTQHFSSRTAVSTWYSPAHDGWLRHDAGNVLRPMRRPSFESTDGTTQKRTPWENRVCKMFFGNCGCC